MENSAPFSVEVCYCGAGAAVLLLPLQVAPGTTIGQAIAQSGVLAAAPEIELSTYPVGVYGKKKGLDTLVRVHDRIEIYRPLLADPKDSRRLRAEKKALKR
ncbi:MAG: RnfH family protein [Pseudomonadota bacterium]